MTNQEKTFADEFVFIRFNSEETDSLTNAGKAAKVAGYELPTGKTEIDQFVKGILCDEDVASYISSETANYKAKMMPEQRRNLWAAITSMSIGTATDWTGHGCIDARI